MDGSWLFGLGEPVNAMAVYNGSLYAAGAFTVDANNCFGTSTNAPAAIKDHCKPHAFYGLT